MSCNRLMVLLAIYRGTLHVEAPMGTRDEDLEILTKRGLIETDPNPQRSSDRKPLMINLGYNTTDRGDKLVRAVLEVLG